MKKLLYTAIIFLNLSVAKAQTNVVTVWYTNSDTVSIGDTAWCELFTSHAFPLNPNTDSVKLYIGNVLVSNLCYSQYDTMPKVSTPHGNLTKIKFIVSNNVTIGNNMYNVDCQDCYPNGHTFPVCVKSNINGIKNYNSKENLISIEYYDLLGNKTTSPNGLTIEIKTYINGSIEIKKIIYF